MTATVTVAVPKSPQPPPSGPALAPAGALRTVGTRPQNVPLRAFGCGGMTGASPLPWTTASSSSQRPCISLNTLSPSFIPSLSVLKAARGFHSYTQFSRYPFFEQNGTSQHTNPPPPPPFKPEAGDAAFAEETVPTQCGGWGGPQVWPGALREGVAAVPWLLAAPEPRPGRRRGEPVSAGTGRLRLSWPSSAWMIEVFRSCSSFKTKDDCALSAL
ncbi:uncharacterized protein ACOB8E_001321 isoform 3-T5 [Sarcophilus harrisii]